MLWSQLPALPGAGLAVALLTAGWTHSYHVRAPERAWNSKRVGEALPKPWLCPGAVLPLQFDKTRDLLGSHQGCVAAGEMRLILRSFGDSSVPVLPPAPPVLAPCWS